MSGALIVSSSTSSREPVTLPAGLIAGFLPHSPAWLVRRGVFCVGACYLFRGLSGKGFLPLGVAME